MSAEEIFDLVDEHGGRIGTATRSQCHRDASLLHPVVHALVLNDAGEILLQKRAPDKDIQPDKWDTSMGGHIAAGESIDVALVREVAEELGITTTREAYVFCYRYVMRNEIESELVHTFMLRHNGPFVFQKSEISAIRFWSHEDIRAHMGDGTFTPNFEDEYAHFLSWTAAEPV